MEIEADITSEQSQHTDAKWRSQKRIQKPIAETRKIEFDQGFIGLFLIQAFLLASAWFHFAAPIVIFTFCVCTTAAYVAVRFALQNFQNSPKESEATSKQTLKLSERLELLEDQSWEIRESEDIHRSAAEAFGDIVIHRNAMGGVTFSNSIYSKYFENTAHLPGFEINTFDGDQSSMVRDIKVTTKIGPRWFAWTDLIIRDFETGESGTRSIGRDITERKLHEQSLEARATEAHQASDAKTRFLGMMSHEIRTPLSGILGMTKLLKDSQLTSTQSSHLNAIETSSRTLLELVEDLLDQAQLDTGHMVINKSPTNLVRLVEDVCELLSDRARQKNIIVASHVDARLANSIELDGARLKQVLVNLAGNALKFTELGGVAIDLTLKTSEQSQEPIMSISVRDSGPGIAGQDLDKIFNAFAQADSGSNRPHEGAGLGLAISQDIVRLMGGKIEVHSALDEGTVFQFDLPLHQAEVVEPNQTKTDCVILAMPQTPARDAIAKTAFQYSKKVITVNSTEKLDAITATCPENTVVIVDDEFKVDFQWLDAVRSTIGDSARIIRLEPARGTQTEDTETMFDGWLTWPIRSESLKNTLHDIHGPETTECLNPQTFEDANSGSKAGRSMHVLLAEDNPINTLLATSLLGKLGHRVAHAEDGEKAYEFFARAGSASPFDIILMDLHMPNCDGTTAIRSIRKHENEMGTKRTPIVVLSADNQDSSQSDAMSAGADAFLLKPLDFESVTNILDTFSIFEPQDLSQATN